MSNKYVVLSFSLGGEVNEMGVVDATRWPNDIDAFRNKYTNAYVSQYLKSCKVAIFPVSLSQSVEEATQRAREYSSFLNQQHLAMESAKAGVTLGDTPACL